MKFQELSLLLISLGPTQLLAKTLRGNEAGKSKRGLQLTARDTVAPVTQPSPGGAAVFCNDDFYRVQEGQELRIDDFEDGFLLNDEFQPLGTELFVDTWDTVGSFQGDIDRIDRRSDGTFRYQPATGFIGTDAFTYTACLALFPNICSTGFVGIEVYPDPSKPDAIPIARDDEYTLREGETLTITQPGILNNDQTGNPFNPLYICESDERGIVQDIDIDDNGSFEYTADKCWTGTDTFTYQACYEDYPDMVSNVATVRIQVTQDPNRPGEPDAVDDSYSVHEAETLQISSGGLLSNDGSGSLYIREWETVGNFIGDIDVDTDGNFEYTAISGGLGTQEFRYTVCHSDWECVGCRTATARIEVTVNPNKPKTPPQPKSNAIQMAEGEIYRGSLKNAVDYDTQYPVVFESFNKRSGFSGILNYIEDGSFEYGSAPAGLYTFDYRVCYIKWTDLCSTGEVTMTIKGTAPSGPVGGEVTFAPINSGGSFASRQGVATSYQMTWAGQDSSGGCASLEPQLTLSCGGDGEIALLNMGGVSDNNSCKTEAITGDIVCAAQNSGVVYAECRDRSGSTPENRKIVSTLYSNAVSCGGSALPPYHTYHMVAVKTYCGGAFVDRSNSCSAIQMQHNTMGTLCYADQSTASSRAQPLFITLSSVGYDDCLSTSSGADATDRADVPGQPVISLPAQVLEEVGNDGSPSGAFPLQECQGDCDDDDECGPGLVCYQREGTEAVPGCVELGDSGYKYTDFCIRPVAGGSNTLVRNDGAAANGNGVLDVVGDADGDTHPLYPLLECQADCDDDDECMGDLICFHRSGNDAVPGCRGDKSEFSGADFCIRRPTPTIDVGIPSSRSGNPDLP